MTASLVVVMIQAQEYHMKDSESELALLEMFGEKDGMYVHGRYV